MTSDYDHPLTRRFHEYDNVLKRVLRTLLPRRMTDAIARAWISIAARLHYPVGWIVARRHRRRGRSLGVDDGSVSRRRHDYDASLLVNPYLARLEQDSTSDPDTTETTGLSIGYPAWNLLYYSILCSLPPQAEEVVIVETGTNHGISTVVLAQALADSGRRGMVRTVDIDAEVVTLAQEHVAEAGLSELVDFNVGDSLAFLRDLVAQVPEVHFAFLDGLHLYEHVRREFKIIYPRVLSGRGTVYFDNTASGGVSRALRYIGGAFPGNVVDFPNCSWRPPGNAIWQPRTTGRAS